MKSMKEVRKYKYVGFRSLSFVQVNIAMYLLYLSIYSYIHIISQSSNCHQIIHEGNHKGRRNIIINKCTNHLSIKISINKYRQCFHVISNF